MENQITMVERGVFDDMKELERLWVSGEPEHIMKAVGGENVEKKVRVPNRNIYIFPPSPCLTT